MSSVSSTSSLTSATAIDVSSVLAAISNKSTTAIDVSSAVAAGVYADRAPERLWEADQTTLTSETTALTAMQTATEALVTDMQSLNTLTGPLSDRTVTSSNTNEITATAAAGTVAASHTVVVNNIASTGAWYSEAETSSTTILPTSSFTLTTGSGTSAISTTFSTGTGNAGDTLANLATSINSAELGVTATVVSDSNGSRIAILSNSSGIAANFSMSSSYTSWTSPTLTTGETLAAGTIQLTGATSTAGSASIAITAGETFTQLAAAVNSATDSSGKSLGLTATVSTDGNTMTIASSDGKTPFTIDQPSSTSGSLGFTQAVVGADASLTVDGVPIDSASNTVTGAIKGVTLTLLGASSTNAVNLTVAPNTTEISTAINNFVTDYNTAIGLLNAQFSVSTTSTEGVLASDPIVRSLQNALQSTLSYLYTPTSGTTKVSSLYDLGITVGNDGQLTVNSTTLNNMLANNATDVQNFFEGPALNGFAASFNTAMNTYTKGGNGAFTLDLSSISTQYDNLTTQISDYETNYIVPQQTQLTAMYTKAEQALESLSTTMAQIDALLAK